MGTCFLHREHCHSFKQACCGSSYATRLSTMWMVFYGWWMRKADQNAFPLQVLQTVSYHFPLFPRLNLQCVTGVFFVVWSSFPSASMESTVSSQSLARFWGHPECPFSYLTDSCTRSAGDRTVRSKQLIEEHCPNCRKTKHQWRQTGIPRSCCNWDGCLAEVSKSQFQICGC